MTTNAFDLIATEMQRTSGRPLPADPLRRVALVCEESGEALKEALDYTRNTHEDPTKSIPVIIHRARIKHELVQTAAMAIRVLQTMLTEEGK